jgi:hypothetical protein
MLCLPDALEDVFRPTGKRQLDVLAGVPGIQHRPTMCDSTTFPRAVHVRVATVRTVQNHEVVNAVAAEWNGGDNGRTVLLHPEHI